MPTSFRLQRAGLGLRRSRDCPQRGITVCAIAYRSVLREPEPGGAITAGSAEGGNGRDGIRVNCTGVPPSEHIGSRGAHSHRMTHAYTHTPRKNQLLAALPVAGYERLLPSLELT